MTGSSSVPDNLSGNEQNQNSTLASTQIRIFLTHCVKKILTAMPQCVKLNSVMPLCGTIIER
ncbi:MAG: hypothetical protein CSA81_04050 [Acidobacteria bacterium]|nr:MAG: hypothetical protein CSA81_04050 [Acidobacteriota bacterium]